MPKNTFASWNSWPFMITTQPTIPATILHSTQQQSPLFRLPRELRDLVYQYYVAEREGYFYDARTRTISSQSGFTIRLSLPATCKIAAKELRGIAFQNNTINFKTLCSTDDGGQHLGLRSRAGRLKCLLLYTQIQRIRMVISVARLLKAEDLAHIHENYPAHSHWFDFPLQHAIEQQSDHLSGNCTPYDRHEVIGDDEFDNVLQYALELAKARDPSEFAARMSNLYGVGHSPLQKGLGGAWRTLFEEGAFAACYTWRPATWSIPDERELESMETLLTRPWTLDEQLAVTTPRDVFQDLDAHKWAQETKWFFSAAAVAIDFLRRLSFRTRQHMRKITLHEDFKAVSRPECHAEGLIPFCSENPRLRIERRIGFLSNLLPLANHHLDRRSEDEIWNFIFGGECLEAFVGWVEEVWKLRARGMPTQCFVLVIDGTTSPRESSEAWEFVKYAAAMQEGMLEYCQRRNISPNPREQDREITFRSYPLPWHLPARFSQTVRAMINGTGCIHFTGDTGEAWDGKAFIEARKDWTVEEWRKEWKKQVLDKCITTPFCGIVRQRYSHPS
ncbi:uncharacterized protein K460DRAFT_368005 [Cucurbitaria berberidis CBS 394.84]|uniref:Uncharacterized protein n=1 Tax=Cucurbitaria berberidis CBS 394.84 TaxID=1168544 RepID=A0A9P4GCI4_9PLEO|nr:uncharacterized protein K460DRAFT_368005 [Cucurbitaria berberidis CBS 394.84]KAF1843075.1 hypothetical protein K460DRAFT_368005 [Cucurbitaria berberidis CBS 394.84]